MSLNIEHTFSLKDKEQLKKDIAKLSYNEHCEIFNIIRKDTDKISENSNGVFINLKYLKDNTLLKVKNFIIYCKKNKLNNKYSENDVENKNQIDENKSNTSSIQTNNIDIDENLTQGYEVYNFNDNSDNSKDKFNFKNYMDKLSINSFKSFEKNDNSKNNIPTLHNRKLKLSGVRERIMKKCKNISKEHSDTKKLMKSKIKSGNNIVEDILDENVNIDLDSNLSDKSNLYCDIDELSEDN